MERRNTSDLFEAAKNAALEHRTLELERANEDLLGQIASLKQQNGRAGNTDGHAVVLATLEAQVQAAEKRSDTLAIENTNLRTRINLAGGDDAAHGAERKAWQGVTADLGTKLKQKEAEIARLRKLCIHLGTAFAGSM